MALLWFQIIFGSLNIASTHMISSCMAVHLLAWVFNAVGNNPQQYDIMQNMEELGKALKMKTRNGK